MKKFYLLTKTLLAVALLCVGQNAWGAWTTVFTQDYESSIDEGWTTSTSGRYTSAQYTRSGDTHYARYNAGSTNGATLTYAGLTTTSIVGSSYGTSTQYKIEFDMAIIPANANNSSGAQTPVFTLYDSSNNSLCHWQVTTAAKTAAANSTGSFYLGSAGSETASFTANTSPYWYHITIEAASESSTIMTVKDISTTTETEYTLSESFIYLGKFTYVTGKTEGGICLDNLTVSIYTDSEIVSAPTIGDPVYAGANRTITITGGVSSKSNAVTTYYTIDGTDPSASNYAGSFTTSTKDVTISSNCTVKAITISSESVASNITSKAVTVGKLTLNAPTVTVSNLVANGGVYNATYSFASNQTDIMGSPTATLSYTFAGGSSTAGTSYTPTTAGELVVTASAEGYTSNSTIVDITLPNYKQTYFADFSTLEKGSASGYSSYQINKEGCDFYTYTNTFDELTLSGFSLAWGITNARVVGLHARGSAGTVTYKESLPDGFIIDFYCANTTSTYHIYSTTATTSIPQYTGVYNMSIYSPAVSAPISSYGWATFSSDYALDFSKATTGLDAFMITGHEGNVVTKTPVEGTVPAGTGLLLKGAEGSYAIPVVASSSTNVSANKLVAGTGASVSKEDNMTKYVLGVSAGNEAEFQKIDGTAATVAKGKAYLVFNGENLARTMSFEDEKITGVENVEAAPAEATLKDGKFIVDGKLVIFKKGMKFYANGARIY